VILWRVLPYARDAAPTERGGALFFPRAFQGRGRHDNPARYGCLYLGTEAVSAVAEAIAQFRGARGLSEGMLVRGGLPLGIAELELPDDPELIDLDDPRVLQRERLRPSTVATRTRTATQAYAERLFDAHPDAAGIRWWSTFESSWINVTLFDRAARALSTGAPEPLTLDHPAVAEAADLLGLA
jgi:RES domain-containing protein